MDGWVHGRSPGWVCTVGTTRQGRHHEGRQTESRKRTVRGLVPKGHGPRGFPGERHHAWSAASTSSGQLGGRVLWGVAPDDLAVLAHQELGEVPLDGLAAQQAGGLGAQPAVQRAGLGAVDIDLGHHRKAHAVVELAEAGDLVVAAGVLASKLVARKAQHHQTLVAVALVQFFQPGKLRRETAGTGGVDDEQHLAFVLAQRDGAAVDGLGVEVVNRGHGGHLCSGKTRMLAVPRCRRSSACGFLRA
jgi:hypothetical protein